MICRKCNREIPDNVLFCPLCGEEQKEEVTVKPVESFNHYLCCPRCGSKRLNIMGDRDINSALGSGVAGAVLGGAKVGIVAGVAGLKGRTFFVCMDCGMKFRSPDELKAEIEDLKQKQKIEKVLLSILDICGVLMWV